MNTRYLSKSQFTRGLQCPKSLWLYRERPELRDAVAPDQQAIFDQGTEVGILAQKWIKGGVLIAFGHEHPQEALEATAAAIARGANVLYEAAFLHEGVLVRADIIAKNPEGAWDLYEVKSTTDVQDTHLQDVAVQRHVITGAGLPLTRSHVVHLDSSYVRKGPLDLTFLFKAVDVTEETAPLLLEVPVHLQAMKAVAVAAEAPEVPIGPHCTKPHDCDFTGTCWAKVPDYSVFNLAGARKDRTARLWHGGIKTVDKIPDYDKNDEATDDYKLTAAQTVQRAVARSGKAHIDIPGIAKLLAGLSFPRYFLDFEAINPAIPPYDGLRPYQPMPFQASIHKQAERGAPLDHYEFLGDGTCDPRRDLINFMFDHSGDRGPVIAYHKSYEGGIIKGLAGMIGRSADELLAIEARLWDLADPFRKALYAAPSMKGSWSIKKVLPALVPEMTYEGMDIADGTAAMRAYAEMMNPATTPERRAQLAAGLKVYCGQDTIGMVQILDVLEAMVNGVAA